MSRPAIRRAVEMARDALRDAGAELIPWQPPRLNEVLDLYFSLLSADGGAGFQMLLRDEEIDFRVQKLLHFARLSAPFRWLATFWQREFQSPRLSRILAAAGPRWACSWELDFAGFGRMRADSAAGKPFPMATASTLCNGRGERSWWISKAPKGSAEVAPPPGSPGGVVGAGDIDQFDLVGAGARRRHAAPGAGAELAVHRLPLGQFHRRMRRPTNACARWASPSSTRAWGLHACAGWKSAWMAMPSPTRPR